MNTTERDGVILPEKPKAMEYVMIAGDHDAGLREPIELCYSFEQMEEYAIEAVKLNGGK